MLDTTRLFDTSNNQWKQGPSLKERRKSHSCFYDKLENTIYVIGGQKENKENMEIEKYGNHEYYLRTTEKWNMGRYEWEPSSEFPLPMVDSAAVASKRVDFIGFVTGGFFNLPEIGYSDYDYLTWSYETQSNVWGLRRKDLTWILMPQTLPIRRYNHSILNVGADDIPGC